MNQLASLAHYTNPSLASVVVATVTALFIIVVLFLATSD